MGEHPCRRIFSVTQRRLAPLSVVVAICAALALNLLLPRTPGQSARVYACGLGQGPTMLANKIAAMLYPGSKTSSSSAPIIGMFAPTYIAGQPVAFDEDLSQMVGAPPKNTLTLRWDFGDGGTGNGVSPQHTYAKPGTYNVVSYIIADGTESFFDSAAISVIGAAFPDPPVAVINASATAVAAGSSVTFDANGSHALVGTSLTYSWNFADSDVATGEHVSHVFSGAKLGSSFVTLIVTDSRGARSVATSPIVVVQELPKAQLTADDTSVSTGQNVSFDASDSTPPTQPPGDQLARYVWSFGDGTSSVTTAIPQIRHSFLKAGNFTVTVQAYDQQNAYGSAQVRISVVALASVGGGGAPWLPIGGVLVLLALLAGGYFFIRNQQERAELEQRQIAARELARARRLPSGTQSRQQDMLPRRLRSGGSGQQGQWGAPSRPGAGSGGRSAPPSGRPPSGPQSQRPPRQGGGNGQAGRPPYGSRPRAPYDEDETSGWRG
ncbi:MAG: cytochrome c551/c552 [Ktedonobacterales bacterium]|nr:MAG: cytochrome c551/c552 [Ktedonobacterales bacterium]